MENQELAGCRNDSDPFTLESLRSIQPYRIINIEDDCFDLKPLFNWVYNLNKKTNPLTNVRFTEDQLVAIKSKALQVFPFVVDISKHVYDDEDSQQFDTTNLTSWERIFLNTVSILTGETTKNFSLRQVILYVTENRLLLITVSNTSADNRQIPISEHLRREIVESSPIGIVDNGSIRIMYKTNATTQTASDAQNFISIFRHHNWPLGQLERNLGITEANRPPPRVNSNIENASRYAEEARQRNLQRLAQGPVIQGARGEDGALIYMIHISIAYPISLISAREYPIQRMRDQPGVYNNTRITTLLNVMHSFPDDATISDMFASVLVDIKTINQDLLQSRLTGVRISASGLQLSDSREYANAQTLLVDLRNPNRHIAGSERMPRRINLFLSANYQRRGDDMDFPTLN